MTQGPAGLRPHILLLAALALLGALYSVWTRSEVIGQLGADGPAYLMMAEHYSPFAAPDPVHAEAGTYGRFPPLYPALLAGSDAASDLQRAHTITACCLLPALLLLYLWLCAEGLPRDQSALLVLLTGLLPGTWIAALAVQSEYLYLAFSLLALGLLAAYRRRQSRGLLLGAALAVAAAALTRAVGITLLPALLLVAWKAPRRTAVQALLVAGLPLLAWQLLHRSHLGYGEILTLTFSYNGPGLLLHQLAVELPALHLGFGDNFLRTPALRPLADLLGLLCLGSAAWRAKQGAPDGIYVLGQLGLLLIWPFPEEAQRFLWVLVPVLLGQALLVLRQAGLRENAAAALAAAGAGLVLAMILPAVMLGADRYRDASFSDLPGARAYSAWYAADAADAQATTTTQVTLVNTLEAIADYVPPAGCVIGARPDLINYFARRRSEFPPLHSVPQPRFAALIRQTGCGYVFATNTQDSTYPLPMYPWERLQPGLRTLFVSTQQLEPAAPGGQGTRVILASLGQLPPAAPQ